MFERFTEAARRSLFFARATAAVRDAEAIAPEDLLDGVLLAAPQAAQRIGSSNIEVLSPHQTPEQLQSHISGDEVGWRRRAGKEIPLDERVTVVLNRAAQEADALHHVGVHPEHLLLGLLQEEQTEACRRLRDAGVSLQDGRRHLATGLWDKPLTDGQTLCDRLNTEPADEGES
jgi:ATP-dependent Clp protease ATP-binding subunit ClpC